MHTAHGNDAIHTTETERIRKKEPDANLAPRPRPNGEKIPMPVIATRRLMNAERRMKN
jgi:hypothetical protein